MRALLLFSWVSFAFALQAETPTVADYDAQLARLTPQASEAERLAVVTWLLGHFGSPNAPHAIPALERLIQKDAAPAVRRKAVAALIQTAHRHEIACPLGLALALRDPVEEVRWEAAVLAGPYRKAPMPDVLDALIAGVTDEREGVRSTGLFLLSLGAGKEPKARAAIEKAKSDKLFEIRAAAHNAWFLATDDMPTFLVYFLRTLEDPAAVLDALPEGSEAANHQRVQRNLFLLGAANRMAPWPDERPDDLAAALVRLLNDRSPAIRRGAIAWMGASVRKWPQPPAGNPGVAALLPVFEPEAKVSDKAEKPEPSKTHASLLALKADARLLEMQTKDPDESVRAAAKLALERFREVARP